MIKVLLIDDEQPALDELEFLLNNYPALHIEGKFSNPKKALEYILLHDVDAVFLDISMPELDGFMLAEALIRLRKPPYIIFATAYDEYAIRAFEVNAIDYLLKPITNDRLETTISRLLEVTENRKYMKTNQQERDNQALKQLLNQRYKDNATTRLPLWKNDRIHLVNPNDIAYVETKEGETHLHTRKGDFISSESLTHYEDILSCYSFFRCHRSYMIHLDLIAEVIPWFNNTYVVKVQGYDVEIPISRRNIRAFKNLLNIS
jgi:DNA-binding LytR/AlgR family response regulator